MFREGLFCKANAHKFEFFKKLRTIQFLGTGFVNKVVTLHNEQKDLVNETIEFRNLKASNKVKKGRKNTYESLNEL